MYKWHQLATGPRRPLTSDVSRVTDGIAESLRQFSLAAARADEGSASGRSQPVSRVSRNRDAAAQLSNLSPSAPRPAKGVDARSLSASAPQRLNVNPRARPLGPAARGRGGGGRGRGGGRGPRDDRDDDRAERRERREREQPARVERPEPVKETGENVGFLDLTPENKKNVPAVLHDLIPDYPRFTPYQPETSRDSLAQFLPNIATNKSADGLVSNIQSHMRQMGGQRPGVPLSALRHLQNTRDAEGTLFEDAAERAHVLDYKKTRGFKTTLDPSGSSRRFKFFAPEAQSRRDILQTLVAGAYPKPVSALASEPGVNVDSHAIKNSTYLASDAAAFKTKLAALMPAAPPPKAAKKAAKKVAK